MHGVILRMMKNNKTCFSHKNENISEQINLVVLEL